MESKMQRWERLRNKNNPESGWFVIVTMHNYTVNQ